LESLYEFLQLTLLADALGQNSYEVLGKMQEKSSRKEEHGLLPIIFSQQLRL
jgi:hypothetical protein